MFTDFLDTGRRDVWNRLAELKEIGCLAGGTALAMQLNHRVSYDFDVFTSLPMAEKFLLKVRKVFWEYEITPVVDGGDELTIQISGDINLTWLFFPFPALEAPVKTDSLDVLSVNDLLANKAYALGRRKTWRDYADIYWALKNKIIDLEKLISLTTKKFDGVFAGKLFLEQLVYFDDVEEKTVDWIGEGVGNEEIKEWLQDEVEKYLDH